jgi:hypothetical protein
VVGHLGPVGLEIRRVEHLQNLRHAAVEACPCAAGISSYSVSRVRAWTKRSQPSQPGTSSTIRVSIAS